MYHPAGAWFSTPFFRSMNNGPGIFLLRLTRLQKELVFRQPCLVFLLRNWHRWPLVRRDIPFCVARVERLAMSEPARQLPFFVNADPPNSQMTKRQVKDIWKQGLHEQVHLLPALASYDYQRKEWCEQDPETRQMLPSVAAGEDESAIGPIKVEWAHRKKYPWEWRLVEPDWRGAKGKSPAAHTSAESSSKATTSKGAP